MSNAVTPGDINWSAGAKLSNVCGMHTDARQQARDYYKAAGRSMKADLLALQAHPHGVCLLMPSLVVLMKPVQSSLPHLWGELSLVFPEADAWYIHLLAGNLTQARRMAAALPPLRWLCFQRGRRSPVPHQLDWSAFINK